jgi:hypothetical protein
VDRHRPAARPPYVAAPAGSAWIATRHVGPFVTGGTYRRDGRVVAWESRAHRKHTSRLESETGAVWWVPGAIGWWIGALFVIGSACFALGALPGYADWVGTSADNTTFFIGSVFFTNAATLQYLQTVNASPVADGTPRSRARFVTWEPRRIDWWASAVQLLGTFCFNVSTFAALLDGLDAAQTARLVWRPDATGSICFLVASALAWIEVGHRWVSWQPASLSWWIAFLNLLGSVAFGVSAVAAYVVPDSGQPVNAELVNLGTFVGALCFLAGGLLLMPERAGAARPVLVPSH